MHLVEETVLEGGCHRSPQLHTERRNPSLFQKQMQEDILVALGLGEASKEEAAAGAP